MVFPKKNVKVIVQKYSSIIIAIIFLHLISCTSINGKNASYYLAKGEEVLNTFTLDASTTDISNKEADHILSSNHTSLQENQVLESSKNNNVKIMMGNIKTMTRRQTEEKSEQDVDGPCRSFVVDVTVRNQFEFFSPGYSPTQPYPSLINCIKIIEAPPGHLLRLDFRNEFHLEQSEDCRFDHLEIRDGAHGYSNLIGSYCGNKHPPPITSSDRYLWLRFSSDENIQYSGFHAVYWFIPRPTNSDQHPEMDTCQIEVSGNEGFANRSDIDESRIRFSVTYGLPLDCMWIISVEQGWKIMLQFLKFRLEKPNDCESNFVDVFSDRTDLPSRLKNFCGSIADSVTSKNNILHLRFFAEARSINSTFEALFTAFRDKPRDEVCEEDEYDCEDATCISLDLRCNGRVNCRFRWDEDECQPKLGAFAVSLESEHIIIILVVFCLILSGMCFAFLFNCAKKLIRDHKIIQKHLKQSKESERGTLNSKERSSMAESLPLKITTISNVRSDSNNSSSGSFNQESVKVSPQNNLEQNLSPGNFIPASYDKQITKDRNDEIALGDVENLDVFSLPEMKDIECQTRESLFSTQFFETNPECSSASSILLVDKKNTSMQKFNKIEPKTLPFSTFGYEVGRTPQRMLDDKYAENSDLGEYKKSKRSADEKRYKAEAVIEMETQKGEEENSLRPFSIESTKSAPDVIVTH